MTETPGRESGGAARVARRFERAWKDGARPRIEDYLARVEEPFRPQALERLLRVECDFRREAGEESTFEEYLARFPGHGDVVEAVLGTTPPSSSAMPDDNQRRGRLRETSKQGVSGSEIPPELADHNEYENIRVLGDGGMGVVYRAHNRIMGRDEVLKVMARHIIERPGALERFSREIRAVAKLRHPNIVSAYTAFHCGGSLVFAMEYVDGLDLRRMVKARGPLPIAHACHYVYQAALGLQHAHEEGMVHRDIKPGNLMLSHRRGRAVIKLLDFGLAKATTEENAIELRAAEEGDGGEMERFSTRAGQMLGTPDFVAPEQIFDAQKADIRADIYSLGCTLYYLLTGGPPFRQRSLRDVLQAHTSVMPTPLDRVRGDVPVALAQLVAKMLAKEPAERFQQPADVAQALRPFFKQADSVSVDVDPASVTPAAESAGRQTVVEAPASLDASTDETDFEVLPDPIPTAQALSASGAAKRRRSPTAENAANRRAPTKSRLAVNAAEIGRSVARRLRTPTGIVSLGAVAIGALAITLGALFVRSGPRPNGDDAAPSDSTATKIGAPSESSSGAGSNKAAAPAGTNAAVTASQPATRATTFAPPSTPTTKRVTALASASAAAPVNAIGDMTVNLESARLLASEDASAPGRLEVTLKISNGSSKPINYRSWSDPQIEVELRDQYRNYYGRVVERAQDITISPKTTIVDSLYFEAPPEPASLELRLPLPGSDAAAAFRIIIAAHVVQRPLLASAQPPPSPTVEANAPAAVPAGDPVHDPALRSAIISEHREGMAEINRLAKFKNSNDAVSFRRREPKVLIQKLAKKHNLTEAQVRTIVGQ
jgi:serine/threonine protein kinase